MPRLPMQTGTIVTLHTRDHSKARSYKILGTAGCGSSCIAYYATALNDPEYPRLDNQLVLKEFYPEYTEDSRAERADDGKQLNGIPDGPAMDRFTLNTTLTAQIPDGPYKTYVCRCSELLYGNGTIYYTSDSFHNASSWDQISQKKTYDLGCILTVAEAVARFLQYFHNMGYAYIDLKPENILIRRAGTGEYDYANPMFYDFDSALKFGEYQRRELHITDHVRPNSIPVTGRSTIAVNSALDCRVFATCLKYLITGDKNGDIANSFPDGQISKKVMDHLLELLSLLESECPTCMGAAADKIKEIRNMLLHESENFIKDKNQQLAKSNRIKQLILSGTAVLLSGIMAVFFIWLCFSDNSFVRSHPGTIAVIVALSAIAQTGLKLLSYSAADTAARYQIACRNYDTFPSVQLIENYLCGKRSVGTRLDRGEANIQLQRRRHIWWGVLIVAVLACFMASILLNAFPVLFAFFFVMIIIFIFADCIPSHNRFFRRYAPLSSPNAKAGRARIFMSEYHGTQFRLNDSFYQFRNLMKLHDSVDSDNWDSNHPCVDAIQQIFKMCFDRRKNVKLILSLVLLVLNLIAAFTDFMCLSGHLTAYFRIPKPAMIPITMLLVIGTGIANCIHILWADRDALKTAAAAFYSRFVTNEAVLAKQLKSAVLSGDIQPIDYARGIYQYNAEANRQADDNNCILFHHFELSNRRRLAIVVWLCFGIVFCIFAWLLCQYWLIPLLLIAATAIHLLLRRFCLPNLHKRSIIKDIKELECNA